MIKLSVVIITYNEEANIARCLDSVKNIADEIVIVDSFSSDKTESICKKYNIKFEQHVFEGHIEQKNYAITKATYPHVLSLDADEVVSTMLEKSILEVKANWNFDGYYFNRLNNYCGKWLKHGGWYPDKKLRLWDSRKGKWGGINPHDKYELEKGSSTCFIKGDLLHYSYNSIEQHINQINKFTEIAAKADFLRGRRTNLIKIMLFPKWKFYKDYIIKLGFLDGYYGLIVAKISAHANFIKHIKIKELQKKTKL